MVDRLWDCLSTSARATDAGASRNKKTFINFARQTMEVQRNCALPSPGGAVSSADLAGASDKGAIKCSGAPPACLRVKASQSENSRQPLSRELTNGTQPIGAMITPRAPVWYSIRANAAVLGCSTDCMTPARGCQTISVMFLKVGGNLAANSSTLPTSTRACFRRQTLLNRKWTSATVAAVTRQKSSRRV